MAAIPASMYRRLAAVVDGFRSGENSWFALANEFPHEPLTTADGVTQFTTREAAEAAVAGVMEKGAPAAYEIFGPCKTQRELSRATVTSISATVDGRSRTANVDTDADMVVWSMSAFDKFVAPYYFELWGSNQRAWDQVQAGRASMKASGIFLHKWPTKSAYRLDDRKLFSIFDPEA